LVPRDAGKFTRSTQAAAVRNFQLIYKFPLDGPDREVGIEQKKKETKANFLNKYVTQVIL
jgi:hypothetical protein